MHVDGNAIIGALSLALGTDAAGAALQCANCGHEHLVAEAKVFLRCPGSVICCPECDGFEVTIVENDSEFILTMKGITKLQLATT